MNSEDRDTQRKKAGKEEQNKKSGQATNLHPKQQALTIQQDIALAVQHHNAGRLTEAVASYREVLAIKPDYSEAHNNLGLALQDLGNLEDAVASYRNALATRPDLVQAHNNLGNALKELEQMEEAVSCYREALSIKPDYAEAHNNLGNVLNDLGRLDDAVSCYHEAIAIKPDYAEAYYNLGNVLNKIGKWEETEKCYRRAIELKPNYVIAIENLGIFLLNRGQSASAIEYFHKALELNPYSINAHVSLVGCLDNLVPNWHTPMMNDHLRNDAYLAALQLVVKEDTHVLEIGTGSGLLSLIAARCGAEKVTTCEMSPLIAATAMEIIAANGAADTIKVIANKSTNLEVGVDLPRPADVMVSEIFSIELLGEGVLHNIEDAKRRLLSPEGRIIPSEGRIMIALFGGDHIEKNIMVDDVCGFDMRKFNSITSKKRHLIANDYDVDMLTLEVEAFNFAFNDSNYFPPEQKTLRIPIKTAGKCHGIIQWIRLQMDDSFVFENHPTNKTTVSHWQQVAYIFDEPINIEPDQTAVVSAMHNRNAPWFTLEGIEKG